MREYTDLLSQESNVEVIAAWLNQHPQILTENPLHFAVIANRCNVVKVLLDQGVAIDMLDKFNRTALHYAVEKERVEILHLLLQCNARHFRDAAGHTPLSLALENPESAAFEVLQECYHIKLDIAGIDNIITSQQFPEDLQCAALFYKISRLMRIKENTEEIEFGDSPNSPVLFAVSNGDLDLLNWLLRHGCSLDVKNKDGWNPVCVAVACGQLEMLAHLVKSKNEGGFGLDVNATGWFLVLIAIRMGQRDTLAQLVKPIQHGGYSRSLNVVSSHGYGLVSFAVAHGQSEMLRELVKPKGQGGYSLSLAVKSPNEVCPVMSAIANGQASMLDDLLKPVNQGGYGLSLNIPTSDFGPVLTAIYRGRSAILAKLVRPVAEGGYGCSLQVKSKARGLCPVLVAVANGQKDLLKQLVTPKKQGGYGCELYCKGNDGRDPILCAIEFGKIEILAELAKPINQGGYGLLIKNQTDFIFDPLNIAVSFGQIAVLEKLITPIKEGGYGLSIKYNRKIMLLNAAINNKQNGMLAILIKPISEGGYGLLPKQKHFAALLLLASQKSIDCYETLFVQFLNEMLIKTSLDVAIDWANKSISLVSENQRGQVVSLLISRYRDLIISSLQDNNFAVVEKLSAKLLHFSNHEGRLLIANYHRDAGCHCSAFQLYMKIFSDQNSPSRQIVGVELANLIFIGNVILNADGSLNEEKSQAQKQLSDRERSQQGHDLETMQNRAIMAYEYLHANMSPDANALRSRLNSVLEGKLAPSQNENQVWHHSVIEKFAQYYKQRNAALLNEPAYKDSVKSLQNEYKVLNALRFDFGNNNNARRDESAPQTESNPGPH